MIFQVIKEHLAAFGFMFLLFFMFDWQVTNTLIIIWLIMFMTIDLASWCHRQFPKKQNLWEE